MTVRSTRLYSGVLTNGAYNTIYTVPAGRRLVLRSVVLHTLAGTNPVILLYARSSVSGPLVALKRVPAAAVNTAYIYDTWTVLHAGELLQIYTDGASTHCHASGAVLEE